MKIKTQLCDGIKELEHFLNLKMGHLKHSENIISITQDRMYYTVIYKDFSDELYDSVYEEDE